MIKLCIHIEVKGSSVLVGHITGNNVSDASFQYSEAYLNHPNSHAISLSLPLGNKPFSPAKTRVFFDGLLPEGFMRKTISSSIKASEDDYLSVLSYLGQECLGAIQVFNESVTTNKPSYKLLSKAQLVALAQEGATKSTEIVEKSHLSLTGASGKVGLYFDSSNDKWYQPIGTAPSTHIVKQSHVRYKKIVTNELLALKTAKALGINVSESFILNVGNKTDNALFVTKRYDRKLVGSKNTVGNLKIPFRLHQEDFAQALGILAADKYEIKPHEYLKAMFDILSNQSSVPLQDMLKLWDICIFNYLIGNTDNHIKNNSILYSEDLAKKRLAPAYDIVSTLVYNSATKRMALSIGGEYDITKINRQSFLDEAKHVGLGQKVAMEHFDEMNAKFSGTLKRSACELSDAGYTAANELANSILSFRR